MVEAKTDRFTLKFLKSGCMIIKVVPANAALKLNFSQIGCIKLGFNSKVSHYLRL